MGSSEQSSETFGYSPAAIESKWQAYWAEHKTFKTPNPGDPGFDSDKPKYYVLDMFPYPSGAGLHVGHPLGYTATDVVARYKRMQGFNVLHPMGYDSFGLPAEQYAIQTGVHPAITTRKNIKNMRRQLKMFGFSYDWDRELATSEPDYYKFTQWIFTLMFNSWFDPRVQAAKPISELEKALADGTLGVTEALTVAMDAGNVAWGSLDDAQKRAVINGERLAFIDEVAVNWCPALGTVLANEEVTNEGRSERGDHPVYRRPLRQWMLRITKYADRLLTDLDLVSWPDATNLMQRNWIGRSVGGEVDFPIVTADEVDPASWLVQRQNGYPAKPEANVIRIYTTRPDTLFGATYMVLAPEHPLVEKITTAEQRHAVDAYVTEARHKSDLARTAESKEKTGVFTGAHAMNPVNGERIPVWVADYVLMGYGTGAIMAVPGGDTRDFEFAKQFDLDIIAVVDPTTEWAEKEARLPKGTLEEIRSAATAALKSSVERWKREGVDRSSHVTFAEKYLDEAGADDVLSSDDIRRMYVASPRVFAAPFTGEGEAIQSPAGETPLGDRGCSLNGLKTADAKNAILDWLEANGVGRRAVNYKLRDWIFSRQKYWGEPFPVLHSDDGATEALGLDALAVTLPEMEKFAPDPVADDDAETMPKPPLARAAEWMSVDRDGQSWTRDVNTMPQWAGSCWYYLRFLDPTNDARFCDEAAEKYWMPVDLYVGGAEHAVLHLLYARFWHKVLFDHGYVSTPEPFGKLVHQGMVQAFAYKDKTGRLLSNDVVEERDEGKYTHRETGESVTQIVAKMSKSLKNIVNPDEIIDEFGADTFRLYEMFMGPLEASKPWNTRDVPGLYKLLQRAWRLVVDEQTGALSARLVDGEPDVEQNRILHKTIKGVTEDIEQMKFNTAIARMFEFVNELTPREQRNRSVIERFVLLMGPFAPHVAEELWQRLGHAETLTYERWPAFDPALAKDDEVEIAVQVKGKVKARIMVSADADEKALEAAAMADEKIQSEIADKTVRKVIVVKGRLVNIVAT